MVKRCLAILILHINRIAASVQNEGRDLQPPARARVVKKCPALIIQVDRHPSIEVQRDQRHITFFGCTKQPSLADLTASLTQRKNAEATGVRHHVQTDRVLQRNDTLVVLESTSADRHDEPLDAQLRQFLDDGFPKCLQAAAVFPNLHIHLLPCQTRRDVHVCCGVWFPCLFSLTHVWVSGETQVATTRNTRI